MDEERAYLLGARMLPLLAADMAPDAAGSTAIAMALLAVQAEAEAGMVTSGEGEAIPSGADALLERVHLLPAFVEAARERGGTHDLPTLVRRFVQGESVQSAADQSDPAAAARAARRVRLRELQRGGVDLSLIEATLAQTPLQRITNMERQLRFVQALQRAEREQGANDE